MNYYDEIKNELINNEVIKRVKDYSKNRSDLTIYYNVGKLLSDAGKYYGEGIIKEYSKKLITEVGKKYNERTLRRIRQFYITFKEQKWSTLSTKLSYSHYCEMIQLDNNRINYYTKITIEQNLSVRQLRKRIKNKEYERLPEDTKNKLITNEGGSIEDYIKNPIVIRNNSNYEEVSEKILQKIILEDIEDFMKELGIGFTFIGSEYKIKVGNNYNFIDLLLFNYEYNCFVVIELKVTELKKEIHDNTIGIIIVRKNNKFVMEYCSDNRILTKEYILI